MRSENKQFLQLLSDTEAIGKKNYPVIPLESLVQQAFDTRFGMGSTLAAPLYQRLKTSGVIDRLPRHLKNRLKRMYRVAVQIDTKMRIEQDEAVYTLQSAGIETILLKGAAFNRYLYDPEAPRGMSDFDVLVHPEKYKDAQLSLEKKGYRTVEQCENMFWLEKLQYNKGVANPETKFYLELHRGFAPPYLFDADLDRVFRDAVKISGDNGNTIHGLCAEDALIHLAIHMVKHISIAMHSIVDCHKIYTQHSIDSESLMKKSSVCGALTALYSLLKIARLTMGTPVDEMLLLRISPGGCRRWFAERFYIEAQAPVFKRLWMDRFFRAVNYVMMADRPTDVCRYLGMFAISHLEKILRSIECK